MAVDKEAISFKCNLSLKDICVYSVREHINATSMQTVSR